MKIQDKLSLAENLLRHAAQQTLITEYRGDWEKWDLDGGFTDPKNETFQRAAKIYNRIWKQSRISQ